MRSHGAVALGLGLLAVPSAAAEPRLLGARDFHPGNITDHMIGLSQRHPGARFAVICNAGSDRRLTDCRMEGAAANWVHGDFPRTVAGQIRIRSGVTGPVKINFAVPED